MALSLISLPSFLQENWPRGYNQSQFLAKILGQKTGKQVVSCLRKVRETKDQIGLDGEGRWMNLKGSFELLSNVEMKGLKVLLVDDVLTTGATVFYCCSALLKSGCSEVKVLTVAKSRL